MVAREEFAALCTNLNPIEFCTAGKASPSHMLAPPSKTFLIS